MSWCPPLTPSRNEKLRPLTALPNMNVQIRVVSDWKASAIMSSIQPHVVRVAGRVLLGQLAASSDRPRLPVARVSLDGSIEPLFQRADALQVFVQPLPIGHAQLLAQLLGVGQHAVEQQLVLLGRAPPAAGWRGTAVHRRAAD